MVFYIFCTDLTRCICRVKSERVTLIFFISPSLFLLLDFCSSSSSPSFQPIRSQIPIPTAHVMPSTAGSSASKPQSCVQEDGLSSLESHRSSSGSRTQSGSTSKSSSLSKSASSPNLDAQDSVEVDPVGPKPDCLSRYRSLINGLDHSLFPSDHTRLDDGQRFDTPNVEPTLNQTALLGGLCPDVRLRFPSSGIRDGPDCVSEAYRGGMEHSYKVLPEARPGLPCTAETSNQRGGQPGAAGSAGVYASPLSLQTQALLREHPGSKGYEPLRQDRCSDLSSWQQQQQHKQQLESLRLQVEQMQVRKTYVLVIFTCFLADLFRSWYRSQAFMSFSHVLPWLGGKNVFVLAAMMVRRILWEQQLDNVKTMGVDMWGSRLSVDIEVWPEIQSVTHI